MIPATRINTAGLHATAISASAAAPSIEAELLHAVDLRLPERDFTILQHNCPTTAVRPTPCSP